MAMPIDLSSLKEIIKFSGLTLSEQEEFLSLLERVNGRDFDIISDALKGDPRWAEKFYKNYRLKKEIIKKKDKVVWRELLREERNILKQAEISDY